MIGTSPHTLTFIEVVAQMRKAQKVLTHTSRGSRERAAALFEVARLQREVDGMLERLTDEKAA